MQSRYPGSFGMGAVGRGRDGLPSDLESRLQQAVIYSQVRNVKESLPEQQPPGLPPPGRIGRDLTSTLEQLWASTQNPGSNKQYAGVWDHAQQGSASSGDRPITVLQPAKGASGTGSAISTSSSASWSTVSPGVAKSTLHDYSRDNVEAERPFETRDSQPSEFRERRHDMPHVNSEQQRGIRGGVQGTRQDGGFDFQNRSFPPAHTADAPLATTQQPRDGDTISQWLEEVSAVEPVPVGADFMDEDFMRGLGGLEEAFQDLEDLLPGGDWEMPQNLDMDFDIDGLDYPSGSSLGSLTTPGVQNASSAQPWTPLPLPVPDTQPASNNNGSRQLVSSSEDTAAGEEEWQEGEQAVVVTENGHGNRAGSNPIDLLVSIARAIVAGNILQVQSELTQLSSMASTYGSSSQRMSAYFLEGLLARVSGVSKAGQTPTPVYAQEPMGCNNNLMRSFEVIVNATPYLTFGQLASSSAILEAFVGESHVHVIDFGMGFGIQWQAFIQALAARAGGPPHLRITGVDIGSPNKFKRAHCVVETGRRLTEMARAWGVPFEYHALPCRMEEVQPREMDIRSGEAVAVNCALRLHNLLDEIATPSNPRSAVLRTIRALNPKIVTIVEQTTNQSSPFFLSRFYEALHYYTTMFESIGDSMPEDSNERRIFEQQVLGKAIVNVVACEGQERTERQEPLDQWERRVRKAGFVASPITQVVMQTVYALLKTYKEGYKVVQEGEGSIVLTWKDRPMLSMSSWKSDTSFAG